MKIEIGSKKIKDLTPENLIDIAKIEGVCNYLEFWGNPIVTDFSNTLFSDTIVIDYHQERMSDKKKGKTIVLFFNFTDFTFHWHFENEKEYTRNSRIKIETIKYLIDKGFNLPLH
ncbi:MAG: hypothetical protein ACRC1F_00005 [Metamycoplasmataceae bacterium]